MIYMDPPYGVRFGSNFQPFVRKRDVSHSDDEDMTREPEIMQAYRDTWEMGLLAVVWTSTGLWQVPAHRRLERGFDAALQRWLVSTNWVRTGAWSARGIIALALLVAPR
jgi:hypothetical protein